jgi:histidinol phosphatase-like PHP family hydrolase
MLKIKRFNAIAGDNFKSDQHMHSNFTDGSSTINEIAQTAERIGLEQIIITEHIRKDSKYFKKIFAQIQKARRKYSLEIILGFETKISNFSGDLDIHPDLFKKRPLIVASVHRFPLGRKLYDPREFPEKICQEIEFELSMAALRRKKFDILGHAGGMSLLYWGKFPLKFFKEIIIECKKNNIAFEINTKYHKDILPDLGVILRKHNPFVSVGSDAHSAAEVGSCVKIIRGIFS